VNFNHTPERQMLADTLGRFILDKYDIETRNQAAESATGYERKTWLELAELGMIGALFTEQQGGFGGDAFDIAVLFEIIGRGLVVEPFLDNAVLAGGAIAELGNEAQRPRLAQIIGGEQVGGFAHYEPDTRYELEHLGTVAKQQSGKWLLNGVKSVVRHAEAADFFVVSARTGGAYDDAHGISLFIVPADAPGLSVHGYSTFDGGRAAELRLSDVSIDAASLLGVENEAFPVLERVVGRGVLALSAESLGVMEMAKNATVEYLQSRKQFGVPLGKFQALQHRMAELLIEIEQARSAVINAAAALNKDRLTRESALSAAKFTVGRVGRQVSEEAIQMHGGRLIGIDHELGDTDHHLGRYIALSRGSQASAMNT